MMVASDTGCEGRRGELADRAFIDACEEVISVENQAWMTQWSKSPAT